MGGNPIYWLYGYVLLERVHGFQAIWSGMGSSNHIKLVPFDGITHKRLKSRTIEFFWSSKG